MQQYRRAVGAVATGDADLMQLPASRSKKLHLMVLLMAALAISAAVCGTSHVPAAYASDPAHTVASTSAEVAATPLILGPSALPDGQSGVFYQQAFSAVGGVAPYTFTGAFGAPAPGLALSGEGLLSGIPQADGMYTLTVTATDALGSSVSQPYQLNILTPIAISPPALPDGKIGSGYRQRFSASGGTSPYTFTVTIGSLPPGLALSTSGVFSGRPAADGVYEFSVAAADARGVVGRQGYRLAIASAISIGPPSLPEGVAGAMYSQRLRAGGGTAPYTFSVAGGQLPPGLALSGDGTISGTLTSPGSYTFTVRVSDAIGASRQQQYNLTIVAAGLPIGDPNLVVGSVGSVYSQSLSPSGGTAPYRFALASGLLPPGLSLSSDGRLTGTPSVEGFFTFEVVITDALDRTVSAFYGIVIAEAPLTLSPAALVDGQAGASYRQMLKASGGAPPYRYELRGLLPPGLELRGNGHLVGRPTAAGSYWFGIGVTDRNGRIGGRLYNLTIVQALLFNPSLLGVGQAGTAYLQPLSITGGAAPYSFSVVEGALPPGLSLSASGTLSGRPTTAGLFGFTVGATDASDTIGSQSYTLLVLSPIALSPPSLPGGRVGRTYAQHLDASGGQAPYAFAIAAGELPPGLALGADGVLSGTLAADGLYSFSVSATDARGVVGSRSYSLAVAQAIDISPALLQPGIMSQQYTANLLASGGVAPYTFGLAGGALPPGLSLSAEGVISGTPTLTGTFTATVSVTDTQGLVGRRQYALTIAAPPVVLSPAVLPNGRVGDVYQQQITAGDGSAPYTFLSTELPPGLFLSPSGLLSGTPILAGSFSFTISATSAVGLQVDQGYALTVEPALAVPVQR